MNRDHAPEIIDGLLESQRQRMALQRFADEYQKPARARFGWWLVAAIAPWLAIFIGINAPAIYTAIRHFFGA